MRSCVVPSEAVHHAQSGVSLLMHLLLMYVLLQSQAYALLWSCMFRIYEALQHWLVVPHICQLIAAVWPLE